MERNTVPYSTKSLLLMKSATELTFKPSAFESFSTQMAALAL